jgi:hypothetical protein
LMSFMMLFSMLITNDIKLVLVIIIYIANIPKVLILKNFYEKKFEGLLGNSPSIVETTGVEPVSILP